MNWKPVQQRLGVVADGIAGPVTLAALFQALAGWPMGDRAAIMGRAAAKHFPAYAIDNPLRLAHWFSQWGHESGGFRLMEEGLSYSVNGLMRTWPSRFPNAAAAQPYARNPRALANFVYANRMGNGPPESGDGYRYRGRGPQITGKSNYAAAAARTGLPLLAEPDIAADPANFVHLACDYWSHHCLNVLADFDDPRAITRKVNGGVIGLEDRKAKLAKAKELLL